MTTDPGHPDGPTPRSIPPATTPSRAPRVTDVAELAGVSVGTVSNVLNGRDTVRPEIRERVEAAIDSLSYVPNPTAQALRTGLRRLVGLAVLDITNPFFMEAAAGVERRLDRDGFIMALSSTRADPQEEARLLRTLAGQAVRGVLLTPSDTDLQVAREVTKRGTQVVLFDMPDAPDDFSAVAVDDRAGAGIAVEHLVGLGHRSLLFLNGPHHVRQSRDRAAGVRAAVDRAPGDVALRTLEVAGFTAEAGRRSMGDLLESAGIPAPQGTNGVDEGGGPLQPPTLPPDFPTGIFCANDLIAFGAMTALRDAGVRIPQDISIVGFDDISVAAQMSVPLTTIRQPMLELGWAAADLLLRADHHPHHQTFRPELVVRASTGAPRRA